MNMRVTPPLWDSDEPARNRRILAPEHELILRRELFDRGMAGWGSNNKPTCLIAIGELHDQLVSTIGEAHAKEYLVKGIISLLREAGMENSIKIEALQPTAEQIAEHAKRDPLNSARYHDKFLLEVSIDPDERMQLDTYLYSATDAQRGRPGQFNEKASAAIDKNYRNRH